MNYQNNIRTPQQVVQQPNDSPPVQQHNVPQPQVQQHFRPQVQPSPPVVTFRNQNQNFVVTQPYNNYNEQQKLNYPQHQLKPNPNSQIMQQPQVKKYDNDVISGVIQSNNPIKTIYPNNQNYATEPDGQKHVPKPVLTHVLNRSDSQRSFTALNQSPEPIVMGRLSSASRDYDDASQRRQYVQQPYERMQENLPERSNLQQMSQPKQLVPNLAQQNFVPQQLPQMQVNQQYNQRQSGPIGLNTLITAQREARPQPTVAFQLPGGGDTSGRNVDYYSTNRSQAGMNDERGLTYVYPSSYDRRRPMSVDRLNSKFCMIQCDQFQKRRLWFLC